MVNKATASTTRSREEPDLKSPTIPLRFMSKPVELGATHGLAQWHLGEEGGSGASRGQVQVEAPPLCALWPRASISSSIKRGQCLHSGGRSGRLNKIMDIRCTTCSWCSINGRRSYFYKRKKLDGGLLVHDRLTSDCGSYFLPSISI